MIPTQVGVTVEMDGGRVAAVEMDGGVGMVEVMKRTKWLYLADLRPEQFIHLVSL